MAPKIDPKSIEIGFKTASTRRSKKVMKNDHATRRNSTREESGGVLKTIHQDLKTTGQQQVHHNTHIVPQGHGGGYICRIFGSRQ